MIAHRHQIAVQGRGLQRAGRRPPQHAQDVGGVAQLGVRRDGREARLRAHHRCGIDRRRRHQPQRHFRPVTVPQPRGQGAHGLDGGAVQQSGVQGADLGEHLRPRVAQGGGQVPRRVVEEPVPQQRGHRFETDPLGQLIQAMAADHQTAGLPIHFRQDRVGGDDVIQSDGHGETPIANAPIERALWKLIFGAKVQSSILINVINI